MAAGFGGLASLVHLQRLLVRQINSLIVKPRPDRRGYRSSPSRRVSARTGGSTEYRPELFPWCHRKGQPSHARRQMPTPT